MKVHSVNLSTIDNPTSHTTQVKYDNRYLD